MKVHKYCAACYNVGGRRWAINEQKQWAQSYIEPKEANESQSIPKKENDLVRFAILSCIRHTVWFRLSSVSLNQFLPLFTWLVNLMDHSYLIFIVLPITSSPPLLGKSQPSNYEAVPRSREQETSWYCNQLPAWQSRTALIDVFRLKMSFSNHTHTYAPQSRRTRRRYCSIKI